MWPALPTILSLIFSSLVGIMSAGSFTLIEISEGSSPILFARMIFHIVLCPDKMADSRKLAISTILDLIVECRHQPRKQNLPHLIYQESVGDACEIWQIFFARPNKKACKDPSHCAVWSNCRRGRDSFNYRVRKCRYMQESIEISGQ